MTNEKLENMLDERTRIETIIRKFLPNRLDISDQYVNEKGQIETLALSQFNEDQKAVAYRALAGHYHQKAREFENTAREQIHGLEITELPPAPVFSRPKVDYPDVADLCSMGYPPYKIEAPIHNFVGALSFYLDSLRCIKAISPEFRPDIWQEILQSAKAIGVLEIPDRGIERVFVNSTPLYYPRRFIGMINAVALEIQSTTPQQTRSLQLKDADYYRRLGVTQKKYLLSADSIALSNDWDSENFDQCRFWDMQQVINRSRTAMAFMYGQAGETELAKVLDEFTGEGNSCFHRDKYKSMNSVHNVVQEGDSFKILYKPKFQKFKIGKDLLRFSKEDEED
ncbi:MAG: hypothetical protein AABX07_04295 [Nanoarchaeota archaeon]